MTKDRPEKRLSKLFHLKFTLTCGAMLTREALKTFKTSIYLNIKSLGKQRLRSQSGEEDQINCWRHSIFAPDDLRLERLHSKRLKKSSVYPFFKKMQVLPARN